MSSPQEHIMQEDAANALATLQQANQAPKEGSDFVIPQRFTKSGRKKAIPFPLKLMKVLSNKEFEHIVTWMPSGKSFSIVDSKAFVAEILPDHFKSAKYASFTRKLHRWGFMRHYRGEEAGAFYHNLFRKDRLDLVEQMTCHKEQLASQSASKIAKVAQVAPRPMAQQQPQQQQNMPAPLGDEIMAKLRTQLSISGLQAPPPQVSSAQRLNAAIELEVARRIQERIKAAAVSRQTLAFVNQLQQQQQQAPVQQAPLAYNLQAQFLQQQQFAMMNKGLQKPLGLGDLLSAPAEGTMGLEQLPSVNVPSARTA
eukprot:CAMPEP_0113615764 /NCGR_PEP_ID=MMETSP0017_2-20120614/7879_1 /TAXON_ID=2856 /ORGANISM="Cylindrotheca closterium" /LENGTH=310 /DNA_ID=CAMNT_0000525031 /DNA_START=194 /DNA_END=1126 /DNA_ORIENTATION=+ /assembly_acc=CAM_ASM_000147